MAANCLKENLIIQIEISINYSNMEIEYNFSVLKLILIKFILDEKLLNILFSLVICFVTAVLTGFILKLKIIKIKIKC